MFKMSASIMCKALMISVLATMRTGCVFDQVRSYLDAYAISTTQQIFGSMPLAQDKEQFIRSIAVQMGAPENIIIRRMNVAAMRVFGYYNAFAYFPQVGGFLPISTVPFLFISEGFFEDLSPQEQLFLIGHELAHIKERHVLFLMPCALLGLAASMSVLFMTRHKIRAWLNARIGDSYQNKAFIGVMSVAACALFLASDMLCSAYQRYIERDADYKAFKALHAYDGCLKLIDRFQTEFKMPEHNSYFGLMADHPSCAQRRAYCLALQDQYNQHKDTNDLT